MGEGTSLTNHARGLLFSEQPPPDTRAALVGVALCRSTLPLGGPVIIPTPERAGGTASSRHGRVGAAWTFGPVLVGRTGTDDVGCRPERSSPGVISSPVIFSPVDQPSWTNCVPTPRPPP